MRARSTVACKALFLVIVAGCSSTNGPQYTKDLTVHPDGTLVLQLVSSSDMSDEEMRRTLLTEAARATIDRGEIYLRIDEMSTDSAIEVQPHQSAGTVPPTGGLPQSSASSPDSKVSFSLHRNGTVRFRTSREKPAARRTYDASLLLDQLRNGHLPPP